MAALRRRPPAPLNPYVVLADVAINLMLLLCLLFVVSTNVKDAHFESIMRVFEKRAATYSTLWRVKPRLKRRGGEIELDFRSEDWFQDGSSHLSPAGQQLAQELADLIVDPAPRRAGDGGHPIGQINVTVTQGPEAAPGLDYQRAGTLRAAVEAEFRRTGHRWPFLASGRIQEAEKPAGAAPNEVDVVLELRQPAYGAS